ncbi:MAG TPA: hypothetical protein PKM72_14195 [Nitrospirales bacterium]|nr:hypothetical protein [Nitrospirales bacterium]
MGFIILLEVAQIFRGERHRLQAHSKLVLVISGMLIVGGTLGLLLLEWDIPKTLGNLPIMDEILVGAFLSVSARAAGFISFGVMPLSTSLSFSSGGVAGGTAGGIKTPTFGIIGRFVCIALPHRQDVNFLPGCQR